MGVATRPAVRMWNVEAFDGVITRRQTEEGVVLEGGQPQLGQRRQFGLDQRQQQRAAGRRRRKKRRRRRLAGRSLPTTDNE